VSYFVDKASSLRHALTNICLGKNALFTGVILLALFKLWLVHEEEIYGSANLYDQLNYVRAAEWWYWGAKYSWTAFAHAPAYPLWIALVHTSGLPLRTAQELLFLGGYAVLIGALRAAGVPRLVAILIYAAAILHPASFQLHNHVLTDNIYAAILPMALAGLIFVFFRSRLRDALWTGVVLGILWNVREESILICALLIAFIALFLLWNFLGTRSWKAAALTIGKPTLVIAGVLMLLILEVNYANYRVFHAFSKSDSSAPSVKAAYKALLRIRPNNVIRFIPVSKETRARAYEVSPTFARLKPGLEGETGHDWEYQARINLGINNEIAAGWFLWALRDAANRIGIHKNGKEAASFYWKMADEINRACDEKRLPERTVIFSLVDPGSLASLKYLPKALGRISELFVSRYPRSSQHEDIVLRKAERQLYDEMTSRRAAYSRVGILQIAGWAFRSGDPVKLVGFCAGGEIEAASIRFSPRPDVVEHFSNDPLVPLNSQFILSMDLFRTDDPSRKLIFITESGAEFTSSIAEILDGKSPTSVAVNVGAPLMCWIDSQKIIAPPKSFAVRLEEFVGEYYRLLVRALLYAGMLATLVLIIYFRTAGFGHPIYGVLLLLAVAITLRAGLFIFIDATSFPANEPRYLFPVMPLFTCFLILLIWQSAKVARSTTITKLLPAAERDGTS
jgi:hypothetical protein